MDAAGRAQFLTMANGSPSSIHLETSVSVTIGLSAIAQRGSGFTTIGRRNKQTGQGVS